MLHEKQVKQQYTKGKNIMKTILFASLIAASISFANTTENTDNAPSEKRGAHRAKMLEKFDADGDGKLNEEERAAAKKFREENGGKAKGPRGPKEGAEGGPKGKGPKGPREGAEGARGPKEGAEGGPKGKGPKGPRDPEKMKKILEKFDTDGDGKLSKEEREAMKAAIEAKRAEKNK